MWTPTPDALVTDLGDELVLLHAGRGEMFNLNASGRAAWLALPSDLEGIRAALIAVGAPPEQAEHDALTWLQEMEAQGLLLHT